jgi:hypothetical protein
MNPVHTLTYYFRNIHFNIILTAMPTSPKCSLVLRIKFCTHFSSVSCMLHVPPVSSFDHPNNHCEDYEAPHHVIFFQRHVTYSLSLSLSGSQQPYLRYLQSMLVPYDEKPSFTPIQNYRQNYSFVYSRISRVSMGQQVQELPNRET